MDSLLVVRLHTSTREVVILWPLMLWTTLPLAVDLSAVPALATIILDLTAVSDLHPNAFKILCALHNQAG